MPLGLVLCALLTLTAPSERTFALRWPVTPQNEAVLAARLPQWDEGGAFGRYALQVNPPSTGADSEYDAALLGRLAEQVGSQRLVAVTPTVGTAGWETSNNPGFIPLGGRPVVVPTPRESWFATLAALPVDQVALWYTQPQRVPTGPEFGDYLDTFLAACHTAGRRASLWVPGSWWVDKRPSDLARELSAARLAGFEQLVLTGFAVAVDEIVRAQATPRDEPTEDDALAALAAQAVATTALLSRVTAQVSLERLAIELVDEPRGYARDEVALCEYVARLKAAGLSRLVVRGRLDTPQSPAWQALLQSWGTQP